MEEKTRFIKTFGALLIAALLFAAVPAGEVRAQETIEYDYGKFHADALGASATSTDFYRGTGSWSSNENLMEFYIDPVTQLSLTGVTVDDVDSVVYRTKDDSDGGVDWGFYIYTNGDKNSWYEERLIFEPLYSINYDGAPADTWNTWDSEGSTNQIAFYDDHYSAMGFYYGPTLADLKAGPIDWSNYGYTETSIDYGAQEVLYFKFGTGSAWASTFSGLLDAIELTISGTTYIIDLEEFVDEVFVDDDVLCDGNLPCYATINEGLDAVAEGGTVNVAAGTYDEVGQIVIDKDLTIVGEDKETTIIKPDQDTGSSGDSRGWFLVQDGVTFNLSNVTLDGDGFKVHQAIRSLGAGTINNNIIKNIKYSQYVGLGMVAMGDYNMTFSNNTFSNIERVGMMAYGPGVTNAEISGNTYTGKGEGDWLDYGIEIGGGAVATITGNTISDCVGVAASDGSESGAVLVTDLYGPGTGATINNNNFTNNTIGLAIGYNDADMSVATASGNTFSGNKFSIYAENSKNINLADALANNTFDKAAWIDGGFIVYSSIQDAIDDASNGDTINVAAGTYEENLVIDKALSLLGAGRDVTTVQAVEGRNFNGGGFQSPIVKITGDAALLNLLPLEISAPSGIAGEMNGSLANFGPQPGDDEWNVSGEIVYADDPLGKTIPTNVNGKIALIDRGDIGFSVKAYNAEQGGAIGVIIANTSDDLLTMGVTSGYEDINIPVIMITQTDGNNIKAQAETVNAAFQENPYDINGESITISGFTFHGVVPFEVPRPGMATGDWGTSGIEHLTTQGIETDSSVYPYPARQNITIKDNNFVYAGSSIVLYNVTGFEISNNIMERTSYYYDDPAGYEQYKPHGGMIVHTSGGKNGLVKNNVGFNPGGTISIGGSDIVVEGNTIQAPATPLEGDLAISQYGITTLFGSDIDILNNTITGLKAGPHSSYNDGWPGAGIWIYSTDSNIYVEGNTLQGNTIGVGAQIGDTVVPPILRENKFLDNTYSVLNQTGNISTATVEVDARENYWGFETGPKIYSVSEMGAEDWDEFYELLDDDPTPFPDYAVSDMVLFVPWCQDQDCVNIVPDENGVIEIPAGTSGDVVQQYLNNAPEGTVIKFLGSPTGLPGGFEINTQNLTIILMDGTIIENNSPCFVINADYTKITTESPGGATCVPTSGSNGIDVAAGLTDIIIEGLEIDGSDQDTGDGINFAGAINDVILRDNFIHDLDGDGVEFTTAPAGTVQVQGNLFMDNLGVGVEAPSNVDVTYNAWGHMDGPGLGDGVSTNITTIGNWTHVDLYMESSGTDVTDEVREGETITYTIYANLQRATGADFKLSFDPALLEVSSTTLGSVFTGPATGADVITYNNGTGVIHFAGKPDPFAEQSGADLVLFTVTFTAKADGVSDLEFAEDDFAMSPPSGPSNNIYAAELTDSSVTIRNHFTVTGTVSMQGRTIRSDVSFILTSNSSLLWGPFQTFSIDQISDNVFLSQVVENVYQITIEQDRYLDLVVGSGKTIDVAANMILNPIELFGGDVNNSDSISLDDASIVGGDYYETGDNDGDANFDGIVNIFDLALVGGNYGLVSDTAYSSWTPVTP